MFIGLALAGSISQTVLRLTPIVCAILQLLGILFVVKKFGVGRDRWAQGVTHWHRGQTIFEIDAHDLKTSENGTFQGSGNPKSGPKTSKTASVMTGIQMTFEYWTIITDVTIGHHSKTGPCNPAHMTVIIYMSFQLFFQSKQRIGHGLLLTYTYVSNSNTK